MQKMSLALVAVLIAAVIAGLEVNAENGDAPDESASAEDVIFIDGNRARVDSEYRVQIGQPTDDGTCFQDKGLHFRFGPTVDDEPTGRPAALAHNVAVVELEATEAPCVFDVETHDYTGREAFLLYAAQSGTKEAA